MYKASVYARECGASASAVFLIEAAEDYNASQRRYIAEQEDDNRWWVETLKQDAEGFWEDFADLFADYQAEDPETEYCLNRQGMLLTVTIEGWEYMV